MSLSKRMLQKLPHFIPFAASCSLLYAGLFPISGSVCVPAVELSPIHFLHSGFLLLCAVLCCLKLRLGGYLMFAISARFLLAGFYAWNDIGVIFFILAVWHSFFAVWSLRIVEQERNDPRLSSTFQ